MATPSRTSPATKLVPAPRWLTFSTATAKRMTTGVGSVKPRCCTTSAPLIGWRIAVLGQPNSLNCTGRYHSRPLFRPSTAPALRQCRTRLRSCPNRELVFEPRPNNGLPSGAGNSSAYDDENGKVLWTGTLPAGARSIPVLYAANGVEYLVVSATSPLDGGRANAAAPAQFGAGASDLKRVYVAFAARQEWPEEVER
jgi:hypothetical protein